MTRAHHRLGASASHRWMHCPGSVTASAGLENKSSEYAAEGTMMHDVAELCLGSLGGKASDYVEQEFEVEGFKFTFNEEHAEAVATYVDYVNCLKRNGYEVEIEAKLDLSDIYPGTFGYADAYGYHPKTKHLVVVDFKGGAGIAVDPRENSQGIMYAIGVVKRLHNRGIGKVTIAIVQPRADHPDGPIREWETDAVELLEYTDEYAKAALATEDPNAPLNPGEWCKFCPAAAICKAREASAYEAAFAAFTNDGSVLLDEPKKYSADELAQRLKNVDQIEDWCRRVREFAHHEAEAGRIPPGFKLVAKRAYRKWKDEVAAKAALEQYGFDEADLYERTLKSVAKIEGEIGKRNMKEFADLYEAKSSGTVLAPLSDKRPAVIPEVEGVFDAVKSEN